MQILGLIEPQILHSDLLSRGCFIPRSQASDWVVFFPLAADGRAVADTVTPFLFFKKKKQQQEADKEVKFGLRGAARLA